MYRQYTIAAVLVAVACGVPHLGVAADTFNPTNDSSKTSRNIHLSGKLNPTATHPYLGFWKTTCSEEFGLAIAAADERLYSVSLCGPGGCFRPGTYRPNTLLVGDPEYKIEAPGRIAVSGMGGKLTTYVRCWPAQ